MNEREFWVTCDGCLGVVIWDINHKPYKLSNGMYESDENCIYREFPSDFKKLFGFTPRKGSCRKMKMPLMEIVE